MGAGRWLCIDQGGQSTRAAIFDREGERVAFGQAAVETLRPGPDRVEHAPDALLASVADAVAAALLALPDAERTLRGAALATQRSTLVCAERAGGAALSPVLSWQDRRGAADLDALAGGRAKRIRELTGLPLSPHYGVGKLKWCLEHLEAVRAAARGGDLVAAPLAAFLLYRLGVGRAWQVDPVNASRLLLMELRTLDYSPELLEIFGVTAEQLPALRPCRFRFGGLEVGRASVPLTVCTGDQAAALFAAGDPAAGTVFINAGTGAFIQCATGAAPKAHPGLLSSVAWQDAASRLYVLEGTVNGAAAAVTAALEELGLGAPPSERELEAALAGIGAAPLYLNGVSGLGSPDWVPDFPSRYVGEGGALERLAAVYESVVFLIVRNLDAMRREVRLERIVLTGGLARVDWIARQLASLTGLAVERPADPEATLRGLHHLLTWLPEREGREGREGREEEDGPNRRDASATRFEPEPAEGERSRARYRRWTAELEAALGL